MLMHVSRSNENESHMEQLGRFSAATSEILRECHPFISLLKLSVQC